MNNLRTLAASSNNQVSKDYRPLILYWMLELARMRKISDVAAQAVVCWQHGVGEAQAGLHAQAFHQAL